MFKKISRLKKNNLNRLKRNLIKNSRLKRIVLGEWTQINPTDPETIQQLTDAMTYGYPVQINYEGSGWRTIQPYGWNTSNQQADGSGGNVLLMCYKDTGEVRSYRMDKIQDIFIDFDSSGMIINNNPEITYDNSLNLEDDLDLLVDNLNSEDNNATLNIEDNYPDDMPPIPGVNEEVQIENGIYDEELQMLVDPIPEVNDFDIDNVETNNFEMDNFNTDNTVDQSTVNTDTIEYNEEMEGENQDGENDI